MRIFLSNVKFQTWLFTTPDSVHISLWYFIVTMQIKKKSASWTAPKGVYNKYKLSGSAETQYPANVYIKWTARVLLLTIDHSCAVEHRTHEENRRQSFGSHKAWADNSDTEIIICMRMHSWSIQYDMTEDDNDDDRILWITIGVHNTKVFVTTFSPWVFTVSISTGTAKKRHWQISLDTDPRLGPNTVSPHWGISDRG